jgi:TRAP-type C4-dicarboxylate transport system permease small subunit
MAMFAGAGSGTSAGPVARLVRQGSAALAILGGFLVMALALLVTASVLLRWLTSQGISGDFELAQMGMSIAVFAFLPFCQLHGHNIFVDTFTSGAPRRFQAILDALWALVYAAIAGLIAWQMLIGAWETVANATTTMVLELPLGWAIVVAAFLTAWLTLVALYTAAQALARSRS